MKKTVLLIAFSIALFNVSNACGPYYHLLDGYTYRPSGPITMNEILEFDETMVKDNSNTGISNLQVRYQYISIKKQFAKEFARFYPENFHELTFTEKMKTLAKDLSVGDSIRISFYYSYKSNMNRDKVTMPYYHNRTEQKYVVKTETIANLMREGNNFIKTYPNPSADKVMINCNVTENLEANYFLLDGFGRKIVEAKIEDLTKTETLDLVEYSSGPYYLYLVIEGETFTKKIIKK